MSTLTGGPGKIITNGLVAYFDAANPQSYISGSTTWKDLTSPMTSGSLTGINFDNNKKCLLFSSSSNSVCTFNNSDKFNFNTGSFSIEVIVKLTATASGTVNALWQKRGNSTGAGSITGYQYRILNSDTLAGAPLISIDNGLINNYIVYTTIIPYYTLLHSVFTFNVNNFKISEYVNGKVKFYEPTTSPTITGSFYNNNVNFLLGKNDGNSLDAEYYLLRAYNKVLSQAEIEQNYNSTRARFGI